MWPHIQVLEAQAALGAAPRNPAYSLAILSFLLALGVSASRSVGNPLQVTVGCALSLCVSVAWYAAGTGRKRDRDDGNDVDSQGWSGQRVKWARGGS